MTNDLLDLILEYGFESRWVGVYRATANREEREAAESEAERLLEEIKTYHVVTKANTKDLCHKAAEASYQKWEAEEEER